MFGRGRRRHNWTKGHSMMTAGNSCRVPTVATAASARFREYPLGCGVGRYANFINLSAARLFGPYGLPSDSHISK
jgi:hypothetical protein